MRINQEALPDMRIPMGTETDRAIESIKELTMDKHKEIVGTIICGQDDWEKLDGAINSLSFCDHIVVSFNGNDETFNLLRQNDYGERVDIFQSGFFDFSFARNSCLDRLKQKRIKANWLIWIDADDICTEVLQKTIKKAIKDVEAQDTKNEVDKIALQIENNVAQEIFTQTRLYKQGAIWEGKVHEQIISKGKTANILGAKIIHYGYDDKEVVNQKRQRNRTLIELSMRNKGLNPADCMALGRMELMDGAPEDALKWLYATQCFDLHTEDEDALNYFLGQAYEAIDRPEMAISRYTQSAHPDAAFRLAMLKDDIKELAKYVFAGPQPSKYGTQYGLYSQMAKKKIIE